MPLERKLFPLYDPHRPVSFHVLQESVRIKRGTTECHDGSADFDSSADVADILYNLVDDFDDKRHDSAPERYHYLARIGGLVCLALEHFWASPRTKADMHKADAEEIKGRERTIDGWSFREHIASDTDTRLEREERWRQTHYPSCTIAKLGVRFVVLEKFIGPGSRDAGLWQLARCHDGKYVIDHFYRKEHFRFFGRQEHRSESDAIMARIGGEQTI